MFLFGLLKILGVFCIATDFFSYCMRSVIAVVTEWWDSAFLTDNHGKKYCSVCLAVVVTSLNSASNNIIGIYIHTTEIDLIKRSNHYAYLGGVHTLPYEFIL